MWKFSRLQSWKDYYYKEHTRNLKIQSQKIKNLRWQREEKLKEQVTMSEEKRKLIDCIQKMDEPSYKKFRKRLEEKYIFTVMPHQRVLRKCLPTLVECLEIDRLLDFIIAKDFIDNVQIRDIKEQGTTSEKKRMLIDCLQKLDEPSYNKFKECLEESGQSLSIEILEGEEGKQDEEKYIIVMPHQRVLRKCLPTLVECLEIDRLLDFIIAKDFIDNVQIRDIKEQITTSEKTRMLIDCLLTKNESSYQKFKECLEESGQSSIIEILEGEERKQSEEKHILTENAPAKKKNSVRIKKHPTLQLRPSWRPAVNKISSLLKGSLEWRTCARLVTKNNIKRKMKPDGRNCKMIKYFSAIVIDKTQEIIAFFKNTVKKLYKCYQYLKPKQICILCNKYVHQK